MVNPLVLLPLLNASRTLQGGRCYKQTPAYMPEVVPPTYQNCISAIGYIPLFDKSHALISFGRSPAAGYQVPKRWIHRDCVLRLDVTNEDDVDQATFYEIERTTRALTELCVKHRSPFLGGMTDVGLHGSLTISVFGFSIGKTATTE